MLVLSRKKNETVEIGRGVKVVVVEIRGDKVRLGIDAPRNVGVHRGEVAAAIREKGEAIADAAAEAVKDLRRVLTIARNSTDRRDVWDELDAIEARHAMTTTI